MVELTSDQMTGFHVGLVQSLPMMSAPDPTSATMMLERFRHVPDALEQLAERFLEGAAAGRTPAAICVSRSVNMIEGYLSSPLDDDVFVTLAGPPHSDGQADWDGEAAWRSELRQIAAEVVRPAYRRFADRLTGELLPALPRRRPLRPVVAGRRARAVRRPGGAPHVARPAARGDPRHGHGGGDREAAGRVRRGRGPPVRHHRPGGGARPAAPGPFAALPDGRRDHGRRPRRLRVGVGGHGRLVRAPPAGAVHDRGGARTSSPPTPPPPTTSRPPATVPAAARTSSTPTSPRTRPATRPRRSPSTRPSPATTCSSPSPWS